MKEKFKSLPERDKMLLVMLLFVALLAGMFTLHTKIQDEQEVLIVENEGLISRKELVQASTMDIEETEVELEEKLEEIETIYSKVPDNINSSIDFETMFLSWIEGRNVKVDTFSFGKPEEVRVEFETPIADVSQEDQLGNVAGQLDGLNSESGDVDYSETPDTTNTDGTTTPGVAEDGTPIEVSVPSIKAASFNYKLELSRYEYTRLLDKIGQMSEFYQISATEFSVGEDGLGSGLISVRVFSFEKPDRFRNTDSN